MLSVLGDRFWGILLCALFSQVAFAQVKLPDSSGRGPNLSLDPFESLRFEQIKQRAVRRAAPPPVQEKVVTPPVTNNENNTGTPSTASNPTPKSEPAPVPAPTSKLVTSKSPPYNYTLFLDLDYVNKFSGGASSNPMSDDPEAVPAPTATVGLLHFWGKFDTKKADLWDNGAFVLHWIYGGGTSPTGTVGDLRSVSNIDASFMSDGEMVMPGFDLLELWYEHSFPFSQSSIRFGVGYLSSDFYKSKYTGLFITSGINSIGTEILWNTMASNPPNTTLGLWFKTKLTENIYAQAVGFDGLPDHSTNFVDVKFDENEGVFFASEIGWLEGSAKKEGYFKWGLGYWYLSQNIKQNMMIGVKGYDGNPVATRGFYTVIDKAIDDNIGGFFKGGLAVNGINKYRHYFSVGVVFKGIIASRHDDTAGFAIVQSKLSDTYMQYHGQDEDGERTTFTEETIYELTYSIPVNKWLMIQPDLQYVMQPGMNINNKNALVGILRAEITLL